MKSMDERTAHVERGVTRRQLLKGSVILISGASLEALLAACAVSPQPAAPAPATTVPGQSTSPTTAPSSNVTITALIDAQDEPWYRQRTDAFTQATGIKVDFTAVSTSDYATKRQANLAGDTSTDVFQGSTSDGSYYVFASQNAALDVSPYAQGENFDLKQYFDASIQNLSGPFGGKMYGLPYSGHPSGMHLVYNINLIQAAGAKEPTWDLTTAELIPWAKSVTKGDMWGFYPPVHLWRDIVPMALTFGASLLSADNTKAQLNTPEAMAFWEWLYDIFQVSKVSPLPQDIPSGGFRDLFIAQKLVSASDSVGFRSIIPKIGDTFKWGVVPFPKGPNGQRAGHVQSNALMIWSKSQHPAEAWQWIKWMTSKDSAVALGKISAAPGERPDAWGDPAFANDPISKVSVELMKVGHPVMNPANFRTSEMQSLLIGSLNEVWNGKVKLDQAYMDSLNSQVQAILDKPKP